VTKQFFSKTDWECCSTATRIDEPPLGGLSWRSAGETLSRGSHWGSGGETSSAGGWGQISCAASMGYSTKDRQKYTESTLHLLSV